MPALLHGAGGEMGNRIREHDWSATPLGPIESWPRNLTSAIDLMLAMPQPACICWGRDARFLYNDVARTLLGTKYPDALGRPYLEVWPALAEGLRPALDAIFAGESHRFSDQQFDLDGHREGAERNWFSGTWTPLRDDRGAIGGFFCAAIETTEHVLAMNALHATEDRQTFLLKLGDALRPLADSAAIQGMACRLLGEHLRAHRAYYVEVHEADDVAIVRQDYARGLPSLVGEIPLVNFRWVLPLYKEGYPVVVNDLTTSRFVPDSDRQAMVAVQIISWIAIPLVKHGDLVGALCVGEAEPREWRSAEVTLVAETAERIWAAVERGSAEAALKASEEKYRSLFETMGQGYSLSKMIRDEHGRAVDFVMQELNPAYEQLIGLPVADVRGRRAYDVFPNLEDWWIETYDRVLREDRPARFEHKFEEVGRWYLLHVYPRGDDQFVVMFDDITERKRAEQAQEEARRDAEEATRAREEFLSIASHELRNPAATLSGTAQLLRRAWASGRLTDERLGVYLDSLERAGNHLATLTNDLLDVSRLQRGELPLRPEPTDVAELLRDIVRRGEWPNHRVILETADGRLEAIIDRDRIRQVVSNLLDNGVKYSPSMDEVHMGLRRDDDGLLIEVQDFGIGLPAGSEEAIFTPFNRAPNASESGIPGLGLGLYVSRRVAEQHGGRLWARSEGVNRGTIMSLWLPLRSALPDERTTKGADRA